MDKRFAQAHREARWAVGLTLTYLICWTLAAYIPDSNQGITGLPHWFEMACLLLPLLFLFLCWLMIRVVFRDLPLGDDVSVEDSIPEGNTASKGDQDAN